MDTRPEILNGTVCPYCDKPSEYVDSKDVYRNGQSYGMMYRCKPCGAHVGTHKTDPKKALGRLAKLDLRMAKTDAHYVFDALWERAMKKGRSKHDARSSAYKWLSKELGTPEEFTHIGMFNLEMCKKVVEVCRPYFIGAKNPRY